MSSTHNLTRTHRMYHLALEITVIALITLITLGAKYSVYIIIISKSFMDITHVISTCVIM